MSIETTGNFAIETENCSVKTILPTDLNGTDIADQLMTKSGEIDVFALNSDHWGEILSAIIDRGYAAPLELSLIHISNSKHIDEAIALLQYVFETMDPYEKLELFPGENEPIPNENIPEGQQLYSEEMEVYRGRIAACTDEAERRAIEMEMNACDLGWKEYFATYKYSASPESIQQYREEAADILTPYYTTSVSREEYRVVNEKREQFLLGHISADQYITELERRFVFSVLENQ